MNGPERDPVDDYLSYRFFQERLRREHRGGSRSCLFLTVLASLTIGFVTAIML